MFLRFVSKQGCFFLLFQHVFETLKQTDKPKNIFLVSWTKPKLIEFRSLSDQTENIFSFASRTSCYCTIRFSLMCTTSYMYNVHCNVQSLCIWNPSTSDFNLIADQNKNNINIKHKTVLTSICCPCWGLVIFFYVFYTSHLPFKEGILVFYLHQHF